MSLIPFLNGRLEKADLTVLKSPSANADRRKEPRYGSSGSARVLVPYVSEPQTLSAQVLDVSKSGLRLRLSVPIAPGTLVQIELKSIVASGEVRHCRKDGEEYSVGIQLDALGKNDQNV